MWLLSELLGFVWLQGFAPSDVALFNTLVTSLSKCLAHQATLAASQTALVGVKRRQFYLSHLPAYFSACGLLSVRSFSQPPGNSCGSLCSSGISPFSSGSSHRVVFGQLHCFSLPQETRGHSFVHLECGCSGASPALRVPFPSASSPVHSWPSECSCRFAQLALSSRGV